MLKTIEQYRIKGEELRDWRGRLGRILIFLGLAVLANTFWLDIMFPPLASARNKILLIIIGGVIAAVGLKLRRGSENEILLAVTTILAAIVMVFLEGAMRFLAYIFPLLILLVPLIIWAIRRWGERMGLDEIDS